MRKGRLYKWRVSRSIRTLVIVLVSLIFLLFAGCNLFSLRTPDTNGENIIGMPRSFIELVQSYKESIVSRNINQYGALLSDSFNFRVCDRIYYTNLELYGKWGKETEKRDMQNLFLALARGESYPVFFDEYNIVVLDTTSRDTQFAKVSYFVSFILSSGEIDTAKGFLDIIGVKNLEYWQVDSIHDYAQDGSTCLSDIKVKFLSK